MLLAAVSGETGTDGEGHCSLHVIAIVGLIWKRWRNLCCVLADADAEML